MHQDLSKYQLYPLVQSSHPGDVTVCWGTCSPCSIFHLICACPPARAASALGWELCVSLGKKKTPLSPFPLNGAALNHRHENPHRCCDAGRQLPKGSGCSLQQHTFFFFCVCVFYSILVSVLMLYKFKVCTLSVAARAVYECSKCQECRPVTLDSAPSVWPGLGFTGS